MHNLAISFSEFCAFGVHIWRAASRRGVISDGAQNA
jgi:hypothetical protein